MQTPILDALIELMETVAESQLPLHMENLYASTFALEVNSSGGDELDIHTCGTACCIMGYAALDKNVRAVAGIKVKTNGSTDYQSMAVRVWEKLEEEITEELADSIAGSYTKVRKHNVEDGLFNLSLPADWLSDYPHVSGEKNNDDPAEAVRYMKALRERLQKV